MEAELRPFLNRSDVPTESTNWDSARRIVRKGFIRKSTEHHEQLSRKQGSPLHELFSRLLWRSSFMLRQDTILSIAGQEQSPAQAIPFLRMAGGTVPIARSLFQQHVCLGINLPRYAQVQITVTEPPNVQLHNLATHNPKFAGSHSSQANDGTKLVLTRRKQTSKPLLEDLVSLALAFGLRKPFSLRAFFFVALTIFELACTGIGRNLCGE